MLSNKTNDFTLNTMTYWRKHEKVVTLFPNIEIYRSNNISISRNENQKIILKKRLELYFMFAPLS